MFKRYLLPILVLSLLLASLGSVQSFFMDNVVEPIAFVLWAAWRVIASVDQTVYWILLIAVCFLLVVRLIPDKSESPVKGSYAYTYKSGNRAEYWRSLIEESMSGKADPEALRAGLKELVASAIRKTDEAGPIDLEAITKAENMSLSPASRRFLFPLKGSGSQRNADSWMDRLPLFVAPLRTGKQNRQAIESMDEILRWIEMEMEINDDR